MGLRATAVLALGCLATGAWAEEAAAVFKDAACHMTIFDGNVVHRSDRFP